MNDGQRNIKAAEMVDAEFRDNSIFTLEGIQYLDPKISILSS
jgi:hypothetical protein